MIKINKMKSAFDEFISPIEDRVFKGISYSRDFYMAGT